MIRHGVVRIDDPNVLCTFASPCMIMVAGVPGAGKTTLIRRALPSNALCLAADDYRGRVQWECGQPWEGYDPESIPMARENFLRDVTLLAKNRVNLFLDASYLTAQSQREMCDIAIEHKVYPQLILVEATLSECLEGVKNRERTVPSSLVESFYEDYLSLRTGLLERSWDVPLFSAAIVSRRASNTLQLIL